MDECKKSIRMMTICSRGLSCVMFDKTLQTFRRLGRYERKSITFEPKLNLATWESVTFIDGTASSRKSDLTLIHSLMLVLINDRRHCFFTIIEHDLQNFKKLEAFI